MKIWPLDTRNLEKMELCKKESVKIPPKGEVGSFWEDRGDRYHCGVDLYAPENTEVFSVEKGVVAEIGLIICNHLRSRSFENIAAVFPGDIIVGRYPEHGMLFFSYAKEGEICPYGCPGPRDCCPTFGREKPKTITEYARELRHTIPGWVFESHQMKPGIGGLKGMELKKNLLDILEFIRTLQEDRTI